MIIYKISESNFGYYYFGVYDTNNFEYCKNEIHNQSAYDKEHPLFFFSVLLWQKVQVTQTEYTIEDYYELTQKKGKIYEKHKNDYQCMNLCDLYKDNLDLNRFELG